MSKPTTLVNTEKLLSLMAQLRDPNTGCAWDLKQTFASIVPYTLEEAYEVAEVIANEDWQELPNELGDLLLQVVFYSQMAQEQGRFDFETVAGKICDKLIRRHPHIFAEDGSVLTEQTAKVDWEQIKINERAAKQQLSLMDDIPKSLPALTQAHKIQKRVAKVGFDWHHLEDVLAKIHEEIEEVMVEVHADKVDPTKVQDEMGDLLFAVVNLARHLNVDPEQALRQGNAKFSQRFRRVEQQALASGKAMQAHSLEELEAYWQQAKKQ